MSSIKLAWIAAVCLVAVAALVSSAPTDPEGSTTAAPTTTTTAAAAAAAAATTVAPASTLAPAAADKSDSTTAAASTTAPAATASESSTAPMVAAGEQAHAHIRNTSFTCYNRQVGYYADVEDHCRVYHFCMLGDYNGQELYQRISYLCLDETLFDQQKLDCVKSDKMTAPCEESAKHYDESNAILRKAIIGLPSSDGEATEHGTPAAAAATPAAAATSEPTSASSTSAPPATTPTAAAAAADAATTTPTTTEAPKST